MFPTFTTPRFHLRQINPADQEKVFEGLSHPEVVPYYGVSYKTFEETQAQMEWYQELLEMQSGIWWAICLEEDSSELIGACGFNNWKKEHKCIELGFWLLPTYWKQGVMSECLPHIIAHAFQSMKVHRIEAIVEEGNNQSSRLLEKLNFVYEGTHRECEIKNGRFISLQYFALLSK